MSDPGTPPPDVAFLAWLAGAFGTLVLVWRASNEWLTGRATRAKLDAERFAAVAMSAKVAAERETAEVLGDKLMEELRVAGLTETSLVLKELRLSLDDVRAQLEQERVDGRAFRAAVLVFIGQVAAILPDTPEMVRHKLQDALDVLSSHQGWRR